MTLFDKLLTPSRDAVPEALPEEAVLVDVRSPAEYAMGHVQGAVLLPLNVLAFNADLAIPDKTRPVIVYCQSGARSAMAEQQLRQMGYQRVVNGGGVQALAGSLKREIVR